MSDTAVSLLTAPGVGAIATVEVRGPRAWELACALFVPAGQPLPESPEVNRFWFGTLGNDEVVLALTAPDTVEVHCHGGRHVVRWVIDQFLASGGRQPPVATPTTDDEYEANDGRESGWTRNRGLTPPARLLQFAPTLRTAGILLDQLDGAFAREVRRILALLETEPVDAREPLHRLAELGNTVGRHLVEPWKVVVAGPPNVGKSSLVNALAGYQRTVVSEVAGTTRDAVGVRVAFDGWPFELIDTAGVRDADGLEGEGIARGAEEFARADLRLWVMDCSTRMNWPDTRLPAERLLAVINKCDTTSSWGPAGASWCKRIRENGIAAVSARTGEGIPALAATVVARLVPDPPEPGAAVPYTPQLIELVNRALEEWGEAAQHLRAAL